LVGASFQILDNQQVACGLKLGSVAIWNQNPIFEMGSIRLGVQSSKVQGSNVERFESSGSGILPAGFSLLAIGQQPATSSQ